MNQSESKMQKSAEITRKNRKYGPKVSRRHIFVRGVVQGVGFRPFVYGLARGLGLKGWVNNSSEGVHLEVEGDPQAIERFTADVSRLAPPRARVESLQFHDLEKAGFPDFEIRESVEETGKYQLVSPDIATCPDCRREIFDPADRRFGYPFTNCTNCGPRFTIIEDIPYDRSRTTMARFTMCPECRREYDDPTDRRFHAQPNACPACGPALGLSDREGKALGREEPISAAVRLFREGKIIALKGLGGFLLACDAGNSAAVETLRERKRRPDKPFAVMFPDLDSVRVHCMVRREDEDLLLSPESPIVLVPWKENSSIARAVAPGQKYLGAMVPYTPLHHLLMKRAGIPLVMTSGNFSEEPIAKDNEEALRRLGSIADAFLLHDRDIFVQYDDSVVARVGGRPAILRRARGYAPFPIRLPFSSKPVLACGAELKNTFCLTRDEYAFVSQHIGDLENLETLEHFERTLELYKKLFRIEPETVAYDLHPEYLSTKFAFRLPGKKIGVQHHFAHMVSCLAENGDPGPAIGLSFDGTGFGTDGALWGGEVLLGDYRSFERKAHFEYLPMPGGAAAIRHPWRMALGYVYRLLGRETVMRLLPAFASALRGQAAEENIRVVLQQIDKGLNSPLTSSCGRLFDGVSGLLGLRTSVSYEGQAAVELEMIADPQEEGSYPVVTAQENGQEIIRLAPLFQRILEDFENGISRAAISGRFHNYLVDTAVAICKKIRESGGPVKVALSGGVFQNRLLAEKMESGLAGAGFRVLVHRQVPCNDGGLSLGQAVIANFIDSE